MAGNTADHFGDFEDAEYDVSDTEEEDLADILDGDMSGPDFEDVIPVGHGHYYCLVDSMGLDRYYQIMRGSSSAISGCTPLPPPVPTSISTPTIHTTQSSVSALQPAQVTMP